MTTVITRIEHYKTGCVSVTAELPADKKTANSIQRTALAILNGFRRHAESKYQIRFTPSRLQVAASPAAQSDASSTVEECPPYRQRWDENLFLLKTGKVRAKPWHLHRVDLPSPPKK